MSLVTLLSFRAGLEWFSADARFHLHQVKKPLYFGMQLNHFCTSSQIIPQYYPVRTLIAQHLSLCPCVSDRQGTPQIINTPASETIYVYSYVTTTYVASRRQLSNDSNVVNVPCARCAQRHVKQVLTRTSCHVGSHPSEHLLRSVSVEIPSFCFEACRRKCLQAGNTAEETLGATGQCGPRPCVFRVIPLAPQRRTGGGGAAAKGANL